MQVTAWRLCCWSPNCYKGLSWIPPHLRQDLSRRGPRNQKEPAVYWNCGEKGLMWRKVRSKGSHCGHLPDSQVAGSFIIFVLYSVSSFEIIVCKLEECRLPERRGSSQQSFALMLICLLHKNRGDWLPLYTPHACINVIVQVSSWTQHCTQLSPETYVSVALVLWLLTMIISSSSSSSSFLTSRPFWFRLSHSYNCRPLFSILCFNSPRFNT
jgi:hypothetical protein